MVRNEQKGDATICLYEAATSSSTRGACQESTNFPHIGHKVKLSNQFSA